MDPASRSTMLIEEKKKFSLTDIVTEELEGLIISGFLKPGDRVNEVRLAEKFNVSRGIIREARRGLERAGLLVSIPHRGVFVKQVSREEFIENNEVRALVTGLLCRCAAERTTEEEKTHLQRQLVLMQREADKGNSIEYYKFNIQFHESILNAAKHKRAAKVYRDLVKDSLLARKYTLEGREIMLESNREHQAILAAIETGDGDAAYSAGLAHVKNGLGRWMNSIKDSSC